MMDLSDGLSTDLPRLCAASRVGARIEATKIPVVRLQNRGRSNRLSPSTALDLALNGGDDYELLFTVHPTKARRLPRSFRGVPLTDIGVITPERTIVLAHRDGRSAPLHSRGWDPFRKS